MLDFLEYSLTFFLIQCQELLAIIKTYRNRNQRTSDKNRINTNLISHKNGLQKRRKIRQKKCILFNDIQTQCFVSVYVYVSFSLVTTFYSFIWISIIKLIEIKRENCTVYETQKNYHICACVSVSVFVCMCGYECVYLCVKCVYFFNAFNAWVLTNGI